MHPTTLMRASQPTSRLLLVNMRLGICALTMLLVSCTSGSPEVKIYRGYYVVKNLPKGWELVIRSALSSTVGSDSEWRPADQVDTHWSERIIISDKVFGTVSDEQFLSRLSQKGDCSTFARLGEEHDNKNGFTSSTVVNLCGGRQGESLGEVTAYKVIAVPGSMTPLLLGQRSVQVPAFDANAPSDIAKEKIAELKAWAKGFYVCVADNSGRDCPAGRLTNWKG